MANSLGDLKAWESTEYVFRDYEQNKFFFTFINSIKYMNNRTDSYTLNLYIINVLTERQFLTLNQYFF